MNLLKICAVDSFQQCVLVSVVYGYHTGCVCEMWSYLPSSLGVSLEQPSLLHQNQSAIRHYHSYQHNMISMKSLLVRAENCSIIIIMGRSCLRHVASSTQAQNNSKFGFFPQPRPGSRRRRGEGRPRLFPATEPSIAGYISCYGQKTSTCHWLSAYTPAETVMSH